MRRQFAQPVLEALESRRLFSVTAAVVKNTLTITGDNSDNYIVIGRNGQDYTVGGQVGTVVNVIGSLTATGGVKIKMGSGADTVEVLNCFVGDPAGKTVADVSVDMGGGNDSFFFLADSQARNVAVKDSGGDNNYQVGDGHVETDIWGKLQISGGAGEDTVFIQGSTINGNVDLKLGSGAGSLDLTGLNGLMTNIFGNVTLVNAGTDPQAVTSAAIRSNATGAVAIFGKVSITTGAGNDDVTIGNHVSIIGPTAIKTGSGNDSVTAQGAATDALTLFVGPVTIDTGAGNDTVTVGLCRFARVVSVKTGLGDDTLSSDGSIYQASTTFDVGTGTNTLTNNTNTNVFVGPLVVKGMV